MKDYFLNIQDAYRQPIEQYTQFRESFAKVREGMNGIEKGSGIEVYEKSFNAASAGQAEVYNVGTTALKLCALPWLAVSALYVGKIAYTRHFSYKGLLLAGITFSVGHDLSKIGHTLQKAYVMTREAVREEDERRNLGHSFSKPKQSDFLLNAVSWCVSKPIALKVGADKMDVEFLSSTSRLESVEHKSHEEVSKESLNTRIWGDTNNAFQGTVSQDFMVSATATVNSIREWILG